MTNAAINLSNHDHEVNHKLEYEAHEDPSIYLQLHNQRSSVNLKEHDRAKHRTPLTARHQPDDDDAALHNSESRPDATALDSGNGRREPEKLRLFRARAGGRSFSGSRQLDGLTPPSHRLDQPKNSPATAVECAAIDNSTVSSTNALRWRSARGAGTACSAGRREPPQGGGGSGRQPRAPRAPHSTTPVIPLGARSGGAVAFAQLYCGCASVAARR